MKAAKRVAAGALLLPVEFDTIEIDAEKAVAFAGKEQRYGLYSLREREWVVPMQQADHAAYDLSGTVIVPAGYDRIDSVYGWDGFAVETDGKWGLIDRDGVERSPVRYDGVCTGFAPGVLLYRENGEKKDYHLPDGTRMAAGVEDVVRWIGDAIQIRDNGKYGVVDRSGREVLPCIYDSEPTMDPYIDFLVLADSARAEREQIVVSADAKVMIPAGRYEELRFSCDRGTEDEAVWCFQDDELCAIYDRQGRKLATAPIPVEDCPYEGGEYWPQLGLYAAGGGLYTTDGARVLQADILRGTVPGSNAIYIRRDGSWQVAVLRAYDGSPSAWAAPEIAAADRAGIVPDALRVNWRRPIGREDFCALVMQALHRGGSRRTISRSPIRSPIQATRLWWRPVRSGS